MPEIKPSKTKRCQAITDIIESVALEQAALAHILNAEGLKIQNIIKTEFPEGNGQVGREDNTDMIDKVLEVNKSVKSMVSNITRLEMILQSKLELFEDCICTGCEEEYDIAPSNR